MFRFVYSVIGIINLRPVGNGGSQTHSILVYNSRIGTVCYGGSYLICFLQVVGYIGSVRNVGIGLTSNGVDGGLLAAINQLGFFFRRTAEIRSGLAIGLAHFFHSLIGQLDRCIRTGIICHIMYDGTGGISFYIDSLVGNFVLCFVGDIFRRQAAITSYGRSLITAHCSNQISFVVFYHIARNGSLHFATNGRRQIPANGIGHIF